MEKKIQSGEQLLFFVNGVVGFGKSTVMQKVKDVTDASGKNMIGFCPTSIVATLIDGGTTFHRTFKVNTKDATPEMIGDIFTLDVELIIVSLYDSIKIYCYDGRKIEANLRFY